MTSSAPPFPTARANAFIDITNTISGQIGVYLGALFVISFVTGLLVWGVLEWIGVEFAFTWGLLAFLLNFVPTIGSILASIPPMLMSLLQHYPAVSGLSLA
jgi:AI-2 transport protein TqsA